MITKKGHGPLGSEGPVLISLYSQLNAIKPLTVLKILEKDHVLEGPSTENSTTK